jgi:multidrug transporter EmrE-like cation transporter
MSQFFPLSLVIILNVCGHVFLKAGMNKIGVISPSVLFNDFTKILSTPFIFLGLVAYVASVAMYMVVLSRTHLSYAYPVLNSMAFVLIVLFSWQIFREPFSTFKWIGIALIFVGVLLIGK